MQTASEIRTPAFVGKNFPRRCGIATFTSDLLAAVAAEFSDRLGFAVPVNDIEGGYDFAMSDYATTFATLSLDDTLDAME